METVEHEARGGAVQGQRSIVRTASMNVKVTDLRRADEDARSTVARLGGFIESSQRSGLDTGFPQVTLVARVPVGKFDHAMRSFEALGSLLRSNERSEDVTVALADHEARLRTMLAQEEAYRAMLRQARTVKDSVTLQDRLMDLRADIESLAAQKRALEGQAALSTIELTLTAPDQLPAALSDRQATQDAWTRANASFAAFRRSVTSMAIFMAVFWPVWAVALAPFLALGVYSLKARRRKRAASEVTDA
jgi:hypothetical protein